MADSSESVEMSQNQVENIQEASAQLIEDSQKVTSVEVAPDSNTSQMETDPNTQQLENESISNGTMNDNMNTLQDSNLKTVVESKLQHVSKQGDVPSGADVATDSNSTQLESASNTDEKMQCDENNSDSCSAEDENGGKEDTAAGDQPLSKRQEKKLKKKQQWLDSRGEKREQERQNRKTKRTAVISVAIEQNVAPPPKRPKVYKMKDSQNKLKLAVDLSLQKYMRENDLNKAIQQVQYCYAANRRSENPVQFYVTSLHGRAQRLLYGKSGGADSWDIHFRSADYMDLFGEDNVVYLTSESPNVIEDIDVQKTYIIGGMVDHNHHKGLCYQLAEEKGIEHGQLPIKKYLDLKTRTVLAINHGTSTDVTSKHDPSMNKPDTDAPIQTDAATTFSDKSTTVANIESTSASDTTAESRSKPESVETMQTETATTITNGSDNVDKGAESGSVDPICDKAKVEQPVNQDKGDSKTVIHANKISEQTDTKKENVKVDPSSFEPDWANPDETTWVEMFEILLNYSESHDWKDALMKVIPFRKVAPKNERVFTGACHKCGVVGHFARYCPGRHRSQNQPGFASSVKKAQTSLAEQQRASVDRLMASETKDANVAKLQAEETNTKGETGNEAVSTSESPKQKVPTTLVQMQRVELEKLMASTGNSEMSDKEKMPPNTDEIAPEETTKAPEETTEVPEETAVAPGETTKAPEETVKVPEDTNKTPEEAETGKTEVASNISAMAEPAEEESIGTAV